MATRQTLTFKKEYYQYEFIQEMDKLWNAFADEEIEQNSSNLSFFEASQYIISSMEEGLEKHFQYHFIPNPPMINSATNENKFILCCISGGKDSLATAIHYKELNYNVLLYTVRGINKGYPEEYKATIKLAEKLNLPLYIDEIKLSGKKFYMEHPLKNQIIASMAIAYCIRNNLPPTIAFGNYQEDTNDRSNWGVNWTDNYDLWIYFNKFIQAFIPNAIINIPFYQENEALKILNDNFEIVPYYQSCLMTVRNRGQLKKHNEEKYGVSLFNNRCGSCRKCCLEYIYFCDNNKIPYNEAFYKHCLKILKKKYSEYTGITRKFNNLHEVYLAYFEEDNSKYFTNNLTNK